MVVGALEVQAHGPHDVHALAGLPGDLLLVIYIYIYVYTHTYIHTYIYTNTTYTDEIGTLDPN